MERTTILMVRHATPVSPVPGTLPALDDRRDLTEEGRVAAAALGARLRYHPITAIYSSPARRAVATVEPLATLLGLEIRIERDLIERWVADRIVPDQEWLDAFRMTWDDASFCPAGGESRASTHARAFGALEAIADRHPGGTVVASTHGGLLACVLRGLDDSMTFDEALAIPMPASFFLARADGEWSRVDQQGRSYQATSQ